MTLRIKNKLKFLIHNTDTFLQHVFTPVVRLQVCAITSNRVSQISKSYEEEISTRETRDSFLNLSPTS